MLFRKILNAAPDDRAFNNNSLEGSSQKCLARIGGGGRIGVGRGGEVGRGGGGGVGRREKRGWWEEEELG